ncbi:hypothetical protein SAMN04487764_0099 [Gillisia sp. Hel1_33_143]|uniref:hypothetical protein n=1 Tax=Gillisia sp. Hel1_33_143 TaxID=1336796 RepID=UPI00087B8F53|nr:hypothetical protein [Gillisia sp. Hel1_33_143]SDR66786.1 hypothetical protein SAMN04487764_0099 [Gillisia sp. Hel1_33_143]
MKNLLGTANLLLTLLGCKNDQSDQEYDSSANSNTSYSISGKSERNRQSKDSLNLSNSTTNSEINEASEKLKESFPLGNYIKVGEETDSNCNCYCISINYSDISTFCLVQNEMYINVKFVQNQSGSTDVYYIDISDRNKQGKEIPWNDFDTDSPIANITNIDGNTFELDWLGFKINGDLAKDYAIYGKKTLEGKYKIK